MGTEENILLCLEHIMNVFWLCKTALIETMHIQMVKGLADVLHSECCRNRGEGVGLEHTLLSSPEAVFFSKMNLGSRVHLGSEFPSPGLWVYFEKQIHSCYALMRHKCVPPSLQAMLDWRFGAPQMELSVLAEVAVLSGWCGQMVISLLLKVNMEIPTLGLFPMVNFLHFKPVWPGRKHISTCF